MKKGRLYEQQRAYSAVQNALWSGRLIQPRRCENCNKKCEPLAHHDDYNKKLDVKWLCRKCHIKSHKHDAAEERARRKMLLLEKLSEV